MESCPSMRSTLSTYTKKNKHSCSFKMKPSLKEKVCHFYIVDKGTEILIAYIKIYMLQEEME